MLLSWSKSLTRSYTGITHLTEVILKDMWALYEWSNLNCSRFYCGVVSLILLLSNKQTGAHTHRYTHTSDIDIVRFFIPITYHVCAIGGISWISMSISETPWHLQQLQGHHLNQHSTSVSAEPSGPFLNVCLSSSRKHSHLWNRHLTLTCRYKKKKKMPEESVMDVDGCYCCRCFQASTTVMRLFVQNLSNGSWELRSVTQFLYLVWRRSKKKEKTFLKVEKLSE